MYAHFRKEFGARRDDCLQYVHNGNEDFMQVNFELGVKTDNFKAGINRLDKALSQNRTIALMCTGANPRLREVPQHDLYPTTLNGIKQLLHHSLNEKKTVPLRTRIQNKL